LPTDTASLKWLATSVVGATRTSSDVRFSAAFEGIEDIGAL
jgi:hypothetical protein